ncbi:DUF4391 domain-containing protein [Albibacterium sp.]|uniref:DUF4391 domain-containing protein n=1 Tax=Albibacterium sp. TaxID=2952885 RepID=UPI002B6B54D7|nr:DUF4391 domain-containing protein [Albibacterium sp.]HUH19386.1 DUF4391 domain-containing protein [Albibacterium sp.]
MEVFDLPDAARVNKSIPKNSFDSYTNGKQKKMFSDLISRITWLYKLSTDTINLVGNEIKEIQIFKVELKTQGDIKVLLNIIDKSISYHIVFIVQYDDRVYLSTSVKHPHPLNGDNAVVDWTFRTEWFLPNDIVYEMSLKKSIDAVYHDFCIQLSGNRDKKVLPLPELIENERKIEGLKREISQLRTGIASCKQFNKKVELNLKLKSKEGELERLLAL